MNLPLRMSIPILNFLFSSYHIIRLRLIGCETVFSLFAATLIAWYRFFIWLSIYFFFFHSQLYLKKTLLLADVAMPHQVLKRLRIHSRFCHIGAVCMPAHMGSHLRHLNLVDRIILLTNMIEVMLPMQCVGSFSKVYEGADALQQPAGRVGNPIVFQSFRA